MDIGNSSSNQSIYDAYNSLLFSEDKAILFKMIKRIELFSLVKDLHGDIVECGVFKGAGLALWLKLLNMYSPHDTRKVIGFDFFDPSFVDTLLNPIDREMMGKVFSRIDKHTDYSLELHTVNKKLNAIAPNKFELVKGDIVTTSKTYIESRPGFRISLLYMDLDTDEPTYNTLCNLWDRVVTGGVVVFDEYAYHVWSESNAVDRFIKEYNVTLHKTNVQSPTAYVIKT